MTKRVLAFTFILAFLPFAANAAPKTLPTSYSTTM